MEINRDHRDNRIVEISLYTKKSILRRVSGDLKRLNITRTSEKDSQEEEEEEEEEEETIITTTKGK